MQLRCPKETPRVPVQACKSNTINYHWVEVRCSCFTTVWKIILCVGRVACLRSYVFCLWFKNSLQPFQMCRPGHACLSKYWSRNFFWTIFFWVYYVYKYIDVIKYAHVQLNFILFSAPVEYHLWCVLIHVCDSSSFICKKRNARFHGRSRTRIWSRSFAAVTGYP